MKRLHFILTILFIIDSTNAHNHEIPGLATLSFSPPISFKPSQPQQIQQQTQHILQPQTRQFQSTQNNFFQTRFTNQFQPQPQPQFQQQQQQQQQQQFFSQPQQTFRVVTTASVNQNQFLSNRQRQAIANQPFKFCSFNKTSQIECDTLFPYRSFDGTCNNLKQKWWGKGDTPYKRLLTPAYFDGLNEPRHSIDGSELPNARELACALHSEKHEIEESVNHIFMQWGQFVNHDITSLAVSREEESDLGICSKCTASVKCNPIQIRSNFTCNCITQMTHKCIEFTRATPAFSDLQCTDLVRDQINLQTSYLDASMVYGATKEENEKLRDRQIGRGRMLVQGNNLLPRDMSEKPSDCLDFTQEKRCFLAGDNRVNQNTALMTFHTIFIREHNRIADILSSLNPLWDDETVFQETRRIIVAFIQHITFNEYISLLFGRNNAARMNLLPDQPFVYNPDRDPRISNEYASAAGRFGHSMIRSTYSRVNNEYKTSGHTPYMLRHSYFRANHIYNENEGGLESIVRGLLKDPVMKIDRWFTNEISQHLFEVTDKLGRPFHFDLVSINIQRGRDHGIPGYLKFRDFCRLPQIRSWDEMKRFLHGDVVDVFRSHYRFVEDVDLFSAVVSEFKPEGSLVGPTLNCLLGLQFGDLKFGDRFWYETSESPASFTPAQLAELKKITLSKVLCRNLIDTPRIQPQAMISSRQEGNDLVDCTLLSDLDWSHWKV